MRGAMPRIILFEDIFLKYISEYVIKYFVSAGDDIIVLLLSTCPTVSGCYCYPVSVVCYIVNTVSADLDAVARDNFLTVTPYDTYEFFPEHRSFNISAGDILCFFSNIDIVCHTNTSFRCMERDLK